MGGIGVLNAVVEQSAQNGVLVQAHFRYDLGHRQGMDDIGGAVLPLLNGVLFIGVVHRPVDKGHIGAGHPLMDGIAHGVIVFFKGFQNDQLSFARSRRCMVWLSFRSALPGPGVS